MPDPSAVLSQTLQRLTDVKFGEIEKQLNAFTEFRNKTTPHLNQQESQHDRLTTLLDAIKANPSISDRSEFRDIRRLVGLSKYDPSVPQSLLDGFEKQLQLAIEGKQRSYQFARLYARLLGEWIKPGDTPIDTADDGEPKEVVETQDDFEIVEKDRLRQLVRKFESVAFTAVDTDESEIDVYLHSLFEGEEGASVLEDLRTRTQRWADTFASTHKVFNPTTIRQSIKGLFKEDLLKDEKKTILQEFEKSDTVLNEIADVLNLRFADIENWSWDAPDGLPVEPRRQLNGKYRVMADEVRAVARDVWPRMFELTERLQDVLQAIFLHQIGVNWAVQFKATWSTLAPNDSRRPDLWRDTTTLPQEQVERRRYFDPTSDYEDLLNVASAQRRQRKEFLLAQLPDSVEKSHKNPYDNDDDDDSEDDEPGEESSSPLKQRILRRLATDIITHRSVHGEVAAAQGDLHWFSPGLPHTTVSAVLRFYGVPSQWLKFFESFLKMPLNVGAGLDGTAGEVRIRQRGTPIASVCILSPTIVA